MKCQLEVADDPIDNFVVFDKGDHFHLSAALRAEERINFIDFFYHLRPAFGGHMADLFLNDQRVGGRDTGLTHLSSVGIGVKTVVTNHDLTFIGNVRGHSSNNSNTRSSSFCVDKINKKNYMKTHHQNQSKKLFLGFESAPNHSANAERYIILVRHNFI